MSNDPMQTALPPRSNEDLISLRQKHFLPTAFLYHKEPLQPVRAEGVYVWDESGRKYLDALGGILCISAGHNHPKIKEGLMALLQNNEIQHTSTIYLNRHSAKFAENLVEVAPKKMDRETVKVGFTNSGSEANELALMSARHHTGDTTIINLRQSYHGGTSGVLAHCGQHTWRFKNQPVSQVASAAAPDCYRCPFQKTRSSCSLECAKDVEETIQTTTSGSIAAFIAEPVMGVGGFIAPPKEYFDEVVKIVKNYGGLYISDEVQTGVGRTGGEFFLSDELDIDADIVTMAKGIGNGAALGAILMKENVAASLKGKLYFNTYASDPFQTLQGALTIDIIREENLIENAKVQGTRLMDGLKGLMKNHSLIGDVRGRGLMMGMELVKDRETKKHATQETALLMDIIRDYGVLIGKGGLFGNVIRIAPPLTINEAQVNEVIEVFDKSLHDLKKKL